LQFLQEPDGAEFNGAEFAQVQEVQENGDDCSSETEENKGIQKCHQPKESKKLTEKQLDIAAAVGYIQNRASALPARLLQRSSLVVPSIQTNPLRICVVDSVLLERFSVFFPWGSSGPAEEMTALRLRESGKPPTTPTAISQRRETSRSR
jgi:hypothetical protein